MTRDEGQAAAALPLFDECLALYRQAGDHRGEASALGALANMALALGDSKLRKKNRLPRRRPVQFQVVRSPGGRTDSPSAA